MSKQYRLQELAQHVGATPESLRRWMREDQLVTEMPRGNFIVPAEVCNHLVAHLYTDEARRRLVYRGSRVQERADLENKLAEEMLKSPALKGLQKEQVTRALRGISRRWWKELAMLVQEGYLPATLYMVSPQLEEALRGKVYGTIRSQVRKLVTAKLVRSTCVGRYELFHLEDLRTHLSKATWRGDAPVGHRRRRKTPVRGEQISLPLQSVRVSPEAKGNVVLHLQVVLDADVLKQLRGEEGG